MDRYDRDAINELLAVKLLGWERNPATATWVDPEFPDGVAFKVPQATEDMGEAWKVVEALRAKGWLLEMIVCPDTVSVAFQNDRTLAARVVADGATAPLAICIAAGSALRLEEGQPLHRGSVRLGQE